MKFYSEYTKRMYDSPEECEKAEAAARKVEEEKVNRRATAKKELDDAKAYRDSMKKQSDEAYSAYRDANNRYATLIRKHLETFGAVPPDHRVDDLNFLTTMFFK